jgi:hypothetical protein
MHPQAVAEGVYADTFRPDVRMAYIDYEDDAEVVAITFVEQRLVRGTYALSQPPSTPHPTSPPSGTTDQSRRLDRRAPEHLADRVRTTRTTLPNHDQREIPHVPQ